MKADTAPRKSTHALVPCPECGDPYPLTRASRKFCTQRCANASTNRIIKLGYKIARHAVEWRQAEQGSKASKTALNAMAEHVDQYVAGEDALAAPSGNAPSVRGAGPAVCGEKDD